MYQPQVPLTKFEEERIYMDWMKKSDKKCQKSWFSIRAQKIIDFVTLGLEARRDKLREILARESEENVRACENKFRASELSRKQAIIDEAAHLKAMIKQRNFENSKRELFRQIKLDCDDFRCNKQKQHADTILEDQRMIDQFDAFKKVHDKEREAQLDSLGWDFITDLNGNEVTRLTAKHERDLQNLSEIKEQIAAKEKHNADAVEEKKAEGRAVDEEMEGIRHKQRELEQKKLKDHELMRTNLEEQIQQKLASKQAIKKQEAEFDSFLDKNWQPIRSEINRNQRMHLLNKEAQQFLDHQKQVREHKICEEKVVDEGTQKEAERQRQIRIARNAERKAFLAQLAKEVYEGRRRAIDEKAAMIKAAKERDLCEYNKMLEAMRIQEEKRDREMQAKEKERNCIQEALICQLAENEKRRANDVVKLKQERAGYVQADKEYLDRLNKIANPVALGDFNIHPWRKKELGIPMREP